MTLPLKRALQRLLHDPLAMRILDGDVLAGRVNGAPGI
jgi:hypothetical protein